MQKTKRKDASTNLATEDNNTSTAGFVGTCTFYPCSVPGINNATHDAVDRQASLLNNRTDRDIGILGSRSFPIGQYFLWAFKEYSDW